MFDYILFYRTSENEIEETPQDELTDLEDEDVKNYYRDLDVNKYGDQIADYMTETFAYQNPDEKSLRIKRQAEQPTTEASETSELNVTNPESIAPAEANPISTPGSKIKLLGLRIEESDKEPRIVDEMIPSVLRNTVFMLRMFGEGFTKDTVIAFTHVPESYGSRCHFLLSGTYKVSNIGDKSLMTCSRFVCFVRFGASIGS